jgi:hypothetical protein
MTGSAPTNDPLDSGIRHAFVEAPRQAFIDDARANAVAPGTPVGLLDAREQAMIREALDRGATALQAAELLFRHRYKRIPDQPSPESVSYPKHGSGDQMIDLMREMLRDKEALRGLYSAIEPQVQAYLKDVRNEFDGLKNGWTSFGKDKEEAFNNYLMMRPLYYRWGLEKPADIVFQRIVSANLLGRPIIGGVHQQFAGRLSNLEQTLESFSPGLSARMAQEMASPEGPRGEVAGFVPVYEDEATGKFVPRFVEGSGKLSNHAFGLAIDIDATWNPHIKHRDTIEVLNWVVRDVKVGDRPLNYGELFVEHVKRAQNLPPEKRIDLLLEIHERARQGSERVKGWLEMNLPDYDATGMEEAKKELSKAKAGSKEQAAAKAKLEAAKTKIASARDDLWRLEILIASLGDSHRKVVEEWSKHGIQTIPAFLAAALAKIGFRWGQDYRRSKDAMHFELVAEEEFAYLRRPKPSGFEDLLEEESAF